MFLSACTSSAERVDAVRSALAGSAGRTWRKQLGEWATWLVPVEELVPEAYRYWRPLVRDAMQFVVSRLSPDRLAPKVIEQIEMPANLPAELRLLRLIAKVPGLQKIGQVLGRNPHFEPRFRRALSQLENGISDVTVNEMRAIIHDGLGQRLKTYGVTLGSAILSEATVSAVVPFRWRNPETGRRERGVFKVLKPHIPQCYAEDMRILEQLAGFLARRYIRDRSRFAGVAETLAEIRQLLQHEVDFPREQRTLAAVNEVYGSLPGVRLPRLIGALCTPNITALTHEDGVKVTSALRRQPAERARLAQILAETLLAVPAISRRREIMFHGDPHAGNLLYDRRRDELVILDWALTERLSRNQRRFVLLLVLRTMLRDPGGMAAAIENLRVHRTPDDRGQVRAVRACVDRFLPELPPWRVPGAMDALRLLDEVAREGIRFPTPLLMFRKAAFTLAGVVEDVAGSAVHMDAIVQKYALKHWLTTGLALCSLLSASDFLALEWSVLTFMSRAAVQALRIPRQWLSGTAGGQAIAAEPTSG